MTRGAVVVLGLLVPGAVHAASERDVGYAPPPAWVIAPPDAPEAPLPPDAPVRVRYVDTQVRIGAKGEESYQAYRLKLLTPEALGAGNITIAWTPGAERMTVNHLRIIRGDQSIDVLKAQKFAIIQRENNLERSVLDGELTATLQAPGLQVGDEIEFAATQLRHDPNLGDHPQGFMQFPIVGSRGAFRLRVLSPPARPIAFGATPDMPEPVTTITAGEQDRRYQLLDPASAVIPDGAPPRYSFRRVVQYSTYPSWADLSHLVAPLFARAATLAPSSPVRAEAQRIAASSPDPVRRAEAALQLVQDHIRYVYVALNGGNYRPATVDETWTRRFGDCKAKTVLLVALLAELGIPAEPVLVSSTGGDGTDQRLPTPAVFDHVLVRATIAGRRYWLDGTRAGDRSLAALPPLTARWGLPLSGGAVALEPIAAVAPARPQLIEAVDIDASAGFDKPARVHVQQTLRGDEILAIRAQLAGVAAADADRLQSAYWRQQAAWVEPSKTTWRFDDAARALVLTLEGEGKLDWDGDAADGHSYYLPGGGFTPPDELKRPKDQDQDAAWATDFPRFRCWATTVKLPAAGAGFRWDYLSKPVERELGGIAYWRIAELKNGTIRLAMSRRVLVPEVSANDARAVNAAIKGFDNNKSSVFEAKGGAPDLLGIAAAAESPTRFGTFADYAGAEPPCQAGSRLPR